MASDTHEQQQQQQQQQAAADDLRGEDIVPSGLALAQASAACEPPPRSGAGCFAVCAAQRLRARGGVTSSVVRACRRRLAQVSAWLGVAAGDVLEQETDPAVEAMFEQPHPSL
jgi:hypothetical protein